MADQNCNNLPGQLIVGTNQLIGEDIFIGISNKELLDWRRMAQEEIITGVIQSSSAGDTTATRFAKIDALTRIRMINRTLWLRDPVQFPMNQPVKRTRPLHAYG